MGLFGYANLNSDPLAGGIRRLNINVASIPSGGSVLNQSATFRDGSVLSYDIQNQFVLNIGGASSESIILATIVNSLATATVTISGTVFNDLNHSGTYEVGEPGISGATVILVDPLGGCTSTTADASGNYVFNPNSIGTYTVYETVSSSTGGCPPTTFTQPTGFVGSTTNRKTSITVTTTDISNGTTFANNNFGHDIATAFGCQSFAWQVAVPPSLTTSNLNRIDLTTGNTQTMLNYPQSINAIGYNSLDGFIYGRAASGRISRISPDGTFMTLPVIPTLVPLGFPCGDVNSNGYLYMLTTAGDQMYVVDVNPNRATYNTLVNPANGYAEITSPPYYTAVSPAPFISDWVFNPNDGFLYSATNSTGDVVKIDPITGAVTTLTTTGGVSGGYGAQFFDNQNNLYTIDNTTGRIDQYAISGNTATKSFLANGQGSSSNDGARCSAAPISFASVSATKNVKPYTFTGELITYTIVLNNTGNITAQNVVFMDTIVNNLDFLSNSITLNGASVPNTQTIPNPLIINLGNLPVGANTVTYSVQVNNNSINPIPNEATGYVNFIDNGVTYTNNYASNRVTTQINDATVHPNKTVDKAYASIGDVLTYTVRLQNTGNVTAFNVTLLDDISPSASYVSNSLTLNGISQPGGSPERPNGFNCGTLIPSQGATVTFKVIVTSLPTVNPLANYCSSFYLFFIDPSLTEGYNAGATGNFAYTDIRLADLSNISKYVDKAYGTCGDAITYTIVTPNAGNTTAVNVIFTDTIPNGTTFVANSVYVNDVQQVGATPVTGITLPNIAPNEIITITFKVKIDC